jgi:tRNA (adenine22-N1)-methyltransferase
MRLNKRLLALSEMVELPYPTVWDCCCDHGLLGFKILADGMVKNVNFVDCVPEIIERLNKKLTMYSSQLPANTQWQSLCVDVVNLPLDIDLISSLKSNTRIPRHLIILSGVGGELMIDMIDKLTSQYDGYNIDYLLCPVHHTYKLRKKLISLNFKLKQEQIVVENNRGYELLLVNQQEGELLTLTGERQWKTKKSHHQYLLNLISHYQRIV